MLVLSRKPGDTIHIGEQITITILEVRGSAIRVGIQAPRDVEVLRGELYEAHREQWLEPAPATCEPGRP